MSSKNLICGLGSRCTEPERAFVLDLAKFDQVKSSRDMVACHEGVDALLDMMASEFSLEVRYIYLADNRNHDDCVFPF